MAHDKNQISDAEVSAALNTLLGDVGFRKLQALGFHLQRKDLLLIAE
jgi:hypothetical protein